MSVAYHKTLACLTLPRLHPYLKYSNPRREPRNKINRGFVGIVLLHLNSARSGDTQCRQSYSSLAKREKGGGQECGSAPGLLWLMWCDSVRLLPLIHQGLDLAVFARPAPNSPNYRVSYWRNGAGRRRRAPGGGTSSVTMVPECQRCASFLMDPSLLFAYNIMRSEGLSIKAAILQYFFHPVIL